MSKLTDEQWKKIEAELSGSYGYIDLLIDGYKVTLILQRHKMRLEIGIYVNGKVFEEANLSDGTEIQRRFHWPRRQYVYPAKYRRSVKRMRKSLREELGIEANQCRVYYWPWWHTFKAMKSHLIKNNQSIELIEEKKETGAA